MASLKVSRDFVRKLLMRSLPTDADLDSFVLDFFPEVYQRITQGMQRTQKLNLLLECEPDCSQIVERLHERRSPEVALRNGTRPRLHQPTPNKILFGISVALLIATGAMLVVILSGSWRPAPRVVPSEAAVAPARILDAQPPVLVQPQIINAGSGSPINVVNSPGTKFYDSGPKVKWRAR